MMNSVKSSAIIATGSLLYSGSVLAAALPHVAGPSWEIIAVGAVGLFVTAVGWYAKGVSDKVSHLENKVAELNTIMLKEYHSKNDLNEMLGEIRFSMKALHTRFDKFEGLYGR